MMNASIQVTTMYLLLVTVRLFLY